MTFTKTVQLPVDVDEAFALITQPERLRRWQTVSAQVDLRVGGDYRWTVTPGHLASGTFREVEPGKRIVFGWGWDGSAGPRPGLERRHDHARAGRRRYQRDPRPRGPDRPSRRSGTPRAGTTSSSGLEKAAADRRRRPGRVGRRPREPRPAGQRRGHPGRAPAGAAQPHQRGPHQGHAVQRVRLPRAGRAPLRLDHRPGRDDRRRGEEPRGGVAGEPGRRHGRPGDHRVARPRPRGQRAPPGRRRVPGRAGHQHPVAGVPPARVGLRPGQRPEADRLRRARDVRARAGRAGRPRRPGRRGVRRRGRGPGRRLADGASWWPTRVADRSSPSEPGRAPADYGTCANRAICSRPYDVRRRVSCGTPGSPSRSGCRRSTPSAGSRSPGPRPRP